VAEGIAGNEDRAAVGPVALAQSVGLRLEPTQLVRQREDRGFVCGAQRMMDVELVREALQRMG
jgi:hypothetical protein